MREAGMKGESVQCSVFSVHAAGRKRNVFRSVALAAMLASGGFAADAPTNLVLVAGGKANYALVVPDRPASAAKDYWIYQGPREAAALMQQVVKESTGAELSLADESKAPPGPKVFIGKTLAAKAAGLNLEALAGIDCKLAVKDGNLFLGGNDQPSPGGGTFAALGSKKAVTLFLRDFAGARWLVPSDTGTGTQIPRRDAIAFPSDLSRTWTATIPWVEACGGHRNRVDFEFYTYERCGVQFMSYGGHSYYAAVPKDQYEKSHPEYFALLGGMRVAEGNHLCISRPEVQELIYREMLKHVDAGWQWVELNCTDSYRACECADCEAQRKQHGGAGGHVLFFHNELAKRMLKERPQAKVVIVAYGPTLQPSESVPVFEKNVLIELTSYSPEMFERWRGRAEGFGVYIYNWGTYTALGFAPKTSPRFVAEQVETFRRNGVRFIYCCGIGENWGLEGPAYYIFQHAIETPGLNWEQDLDDYYHAMFGPAYAPMKKLYDTLYAAMDKMSIENVKWRLAPEAAYCLWFPPAVLQTLREQLDKAREIAAKAGDPKLTDRLQMVGNSVRYLYDTAGVFHLYRAYRMQPNWTTCALVLDMLEQRNRTIDELFGADPKEAKNPGGLPPVFGFYEKQSVQWGGRSAGRVGTPFSWNTQGIRAAKVLPLTVLPSAPVARVDDNAIRLDGALDEPAWQKAQPLTLAHAAFGPLAVKTQARVVCDSRSLYISFDNEEPYAKFLGDWIRAHGHDATVYAQDCLEVLVTPAGGRKSYHFICGPASNSYYEAAWGLSDKPGEWRFDHFDPKWNGAWSYAAAIAPPSKKWTTEMRIPFAELGVPAPKPGDTWRLQLVRERFVQNAAENANPINAGEPVIYRWAVSLETTDSETPDTFGEIIFQ